MRPAPAALEGAMMVADACSFNTLTPMSIPMRLQKLDHVVCRLGGQEHDWTSGVVHAFSEGDVEPGDGQIKLLHVKTDPPNSRLVQVPVHDCHLQRMGAGPAPAA